MPRVRVKPLNRFIQSLMDKHRVETLNELAEKTGIPYATLYSYSEINGNHRVFESILRDAHAIGMTADDFMRNLLFDA
jgi:predicted transcriptional regulator